MRIFSTVLVTVLAVLASAAKLVAAERGGLFDSIQDLNLTDDQEAKIADIMKEFRAKREGAKELSSTLKEEAEKVNAVLTAEQKAMVEKMKDDRKDSREECLAHRIANLKDLDLTEEEQTKIAAIRSEFRPEIEKVTKQLEGILTSEQKKAREDGLNSGKKRREILASLNLTDDQKEKVVPLAKEAGTLVRQEVEKIRDVLAAGEREQPGDLKEERRERVRDRWADRVANAKELGLTADQKTKLSDIRKEFRPKVQEAGNKMRASVREELGKIASLIKE